MKGHAKESILKDSAFYGIVRALEKSITVISIPLYTYFLTEGQFGAFDVIVAVSALFSLIADWQFDAGVARFFYQHAESGSLKRFLSTCLWFRLTLLGVLFVLSIPVAPGVGAWLLPQEPLAGPALLVAFSSQAASTLCSLLWLSLRMQGRRQAFMRTTLIFAVLCVSLTAVFMVTGMGIMGPFLAQVAAYATVFCILVVVQRKSLAFTIDFTHIAVILKYSLPMALSPVIGWGYVYLNRLVMARLLTLEEVSHFALASRINVGLTFVASAFQAAWVPSAMKQIGSPDAARFYARNLKHYAIALLAVNLGLAVFAGPLVALLAPSGYREAAHYLPLLTAGTTLMILAVVFDIGNQVAKKTWWSTVARVAGVGVTLGLALLLISSLRVTGVLLGTVIGGAVSFVVVFVTSQRSFPIPHEPRTLLMGALVLTALILGAQLSPRMGGFAVSGLLYLLAGGLIWSMLSQAERNSAIRAARRVVFRSRPEGDTHDFRN